ncbi:MAG TPA: Clp protease ClpP [Aliiroseovarius sp.]|nr:Clp protease ClpP [Aliiroseovarius sp.]
MPDNSLIVNGELVLEGTLVPDEYLIFYETGAFSAGLVRDALTQLSGDITVRVNSPGGDPRGGEAVRVMLAEHDGDVTVKVVGEASSAASLMIMSAERIEMSAGSVMMIHDPSALTWGTAEDHEKTMTSLNVLADTYAGVYAAKAGRSREEMRQTMKDELWMGPEEAMTEGFADSLIAADVAPVDSADPVAASPAIAARAGQPDPIQVARDHHIAAMAGLAAAAQSISNLPPSRMAGQPVAEGGQNLAQMAAKEGNMPNQPTAAETDGQTTTTTPAVTQDDMSQQAPQMSAPDTSAAVAAERARVQGITMAARPHVAIGAISQDLVDDLIDDGTSVEMAAMRILDEMSDGQADIAMARPARAMRVGREAEENVREGMASALTARIMDTDAQSDVARPYMGMSIVEMAAHSTGATPPGYGSYAAREGVIMSAMHATSDFPNILGDAVNRVLAAQYELVDRTFTEVSREMQFNDFRVHNVVRPDEFPSLTKINETGEIKFGSIGDSKETMALAAYATGLGISRQALVNDDLGAIQDVLDNAAAIVPEFEEDIFWATFLANGALADGTPMFHADHGNLAGSGTAITTAAVSAGRKALRQMKAADGKRTIKSNGPNILLVGPSKETEAEQFLKDVAATKAADVNIFSGKLRPVVTEAITDNAWYLLVDPAKRTHNMKHGYLRGRKVPRVRVDEPFGVQGMRMTLEHDFGVGGVNYRGGYKNPGA